MNFIFRCVLCFIFLQPFNSSGQDASKIFSLNSKTSEGKIFSFSGLKKNKASVFYFLAPDCPMCENYTLTFKQLQEKYGASGFGFYGVFPGTWYSSSDIEKFKSDYKLSMTMLVDTKKILVHLFRASITPEVFVINNSGKIIYSGRVDNWMFAVGKKRTVITRHELQDALEAIVNNKPVVVSKTVAVGCYIE